MTQSTLEPLSRLLRPSLVAAVLMAIGATCEYRVLKLHVVSQDTDQPIAGANVLQLPEQRLQQTTPNGTCLVTNPETGHETLVVSYPTFLPETIRSFNHASHANAETVFLSSTLQRVLKGHVFDAVSHARLDNVTILVLHNNARASSDDSGAFTILDFPSGARTLLAIREGYGQADTVVRVTPSATLNVDLKLWDASRLGEIQGRVVDDATGQPIIGAWLDRGVGNNVLTNNQGLYRMTGVPPGYHVIVIGAIGYVGVHVPMWVVERETNTVDARLKEASVMLKN